VINSFEPKNRLLYNIFSDVTLIEIKLAAAYKHCKIIIMYCRGTSVRARMRPWLLIFAGYKAWRSESGPRDGSDKSSWGTSHRAPTGVCDVSLECSNV